MDKAYKFTVIDEFGEYKVFEFKPLEYNNLMELVANEAYEEWGDCQGRAWCGTCHVMVVDDERGEVEPHEQQKIDQLPNKTANSRLACQITIDRSIHNKVFKILKAE